MWQRLTDFYLFAADNIDIPQIRRLAQTVDDWRSSIIEGLFTGISNGRTEGYNRIVKHIGRIAFGFRNPANHNAGYGSPAPAHHARQQPGPEPIKCEDLVLGVSGRSMMRALTAGEQAPRGWRRSSAGRCGPGPAGWRKRSPAGSAITMRSCSRQCSTGWMRHRGHRYRAGPHRRRADPAFPGDGEQTR